MDILKTPLTVLFKEQNPYRIISNYFDFLGKYSHANICEAKFMYLCQNIDKHYSKDEIENLFYLVDENMEKNIQGNKLEKSVFNLFINYSEPMLEDLGDNIQCKYKDLLKWRMTSHKLDQDLFLASYIAYKDILIGRKRTKFDWDVNIKSNNIRLHNMLSRGIVENHFHLKGSAPTYYLSWVSLMNNINNRNLSKVNVDGNRLEQDLDGNINIKEAIVVAALIRVILFYAINLSSSEADHIIFNKKDKDSNKKDKDSNKKDKDSNKKDKDSNKKDKDSNMDISLIEILKRIVDKDKVNSEFISLYSSEIQNHINVIRNIFGKEIRYKNNSVKVDYAITGHKNKNFQSNLDISDKATRLFSGERKLMYECFKLIYLKNEEFNKYTDLFYAYIILKSKFRAELMQVNDMVGFSNFADYQDRKTDYIPSKGILNDAVVPTAILTSIKSQNIVSLEARIAPWDTSYDNRKIIKGFDSIINNQIYNDKNNYWIKKSPIYKEIESRELSISERRLFQNDEVKDVDKISDNYFYVFHFIKMADKDIKSKKSEIKAFMRCRHCSYRYRIKKQAIALFKLREGNPVVSKRVLGIDAVASELVARPEIYGQTFRFLKAHLPSNNFYNELYRFEQIPRLKATYHVGEDFLDVIDGLRAIDEAILFLELTHGDRIGHAIVLGTLGGKIVVVESD